jgi:nucleoside phosphorylase
VTVGSADEAVPIERVMTRILVVAATEPELCGQEGLVCGVGPVEAASATARALALRRPDAVLHVGVAGGRGLEAGTLVVGTEAVYVDIAAAIPVVSRIAPDHDLLTAVLASLPAAPALPIGTSAAVGALHGLHPAAAAVEAMEGFAVLRASALAGVPAVEIRAISNEIGERDRTRWRIDLALDALTTALPALLTSVRGSAD